MVSRVCPGGDRCGDRYESVCRIHDFGLAFSDVGAPT